MKYEIRYETREARCAWCWQPIGEINSHSVVTPVRPPYMELRFHHPCWLEYWNLSGVELDKKGAYKCWSPAMLEALRVSSGIPRQRFAPKIGLSVDTYYRLLNEEPNLLTPAILKRVRAIAVANRFDIKGFIDWSDNRAFFCLRMHLRVSACTLARRIGTVSQASAVKWDRHGVPKMSLRSFARLDKVAKDEKFDRGMIVDDYFWDVPFFQKAFAESGRTIRDWAFAGRLSQEAIRNWLRGKQSVARSSAWSLTRAAIAFGVELPAAGMVPPHRSRPHGGCPVTVMPGSH